VLVSMQRPLPRAVVVPMAEQRIDHSCTAVAHVVNNLWRNPSRSLDVDNKVENRQKPVENPCG
jgi:hypothetical protein